MKHTVASMTFRLPDGREFPFAHDFREYTTEAAHFMFTEGNYSCDCNRLLFLADEHPDEVVDTGKCGDTIELLNFEVTEVDV